MTQLTPLTPHASQILDHLAKVGESLTYCCRNWGSDPKDTDQDNFISLANTVEEADNLLRAFAKEVRIKLE